MPNKMTGLLQDPAFMLGAGILANNTGHYGAFGPAFGAGVFQAGQAQRQNQLLQVEQQKMGLLEQKNERESSKVERERVKRERVKQLMEVVNTSKDPGIVKRATAELMRLEGSYGKAHSLLFPEAEKREMKKAADNRWRYTDTGELAYPGVEPKVDEKSGDYNLQTKRIQLADNQIITGLIDPRTPGKAFRANGEIIPPNQIRGIMAPIQTTKDIPAGVTTRQMQNYESNESLIREIDNAVAIADETDFGATGWVRKTWQDVRGQASAITNAITTVESDARQQNPEDFTYSKWFDPDLPALDVYRNSLAYKLAKAKDPSGRLSDFDVEMAMKEVGGSGPIANIQDFRARMKIAKERSISNINTAAGRLEHPKYPAYKAKAKDEDAELRSLYQ